ncbi:MAG: Pyridoxamine 5'-phosphate oxidase [Parcubacteria group bacterium GW2011_GWA2_56_7]|nr:MAG: Pyridoxamine 5'-phosphate oxidase [Parcubacteria group bacterium GW2011_GWA2_56_7]
MERNQLKRTILQFIQSHTLGVVATASADGRPEAAMVEFGETDDLEIIFDTFDASRKFQNLQNNDKVAFVIGGWESDITVQYEGLATIPEGEDLDRCKEYFFKKNPHAKKWETRPGIVFVKVAPTWIRYSDLGKDPWDVHELDFPLAT